jgi:hypothetical protein
VSSRKIRLIRTSSPAWKFSSVQMVFLVILTWHFLTLAKLVLFNVAKLETPRLKDLRWHGFIVQFCEPMSWLAVTWFCDRLLCRSNLITWGKGRRSRSQWPRGLRRRSAVARMLRLWVRIMDVCCKCCVLSCRGLCDELVTRPKDTDFGASLCVI